MAKDRYHEAVMTALIKDGWTIVKEPFRIRPQKRLTDYIDIPAEKYIVARKKKEWILVEVKSFQKISTTHEFHSAIGQCLTYQAALEYLKINRKLFLAIPLDAYEGFFQKPFIKFMIKKHQINLLPFNPDEKILVK